MFCTTRLVLGDGAEHDGGCIITALRVINIKHWAGGCNPTMTVVSTSTVLHCLQKLYNLGLGRLFQG